MAGDEPWRDLSLNGSGRAHSRPSRVGCGPAEGPESASCLVEQPAGDAAATEAFARKILLDQLTGQARTRQELAKRLAAKQVPEVVAGQLLDRFEEVGLIDDASFAAQWVDSRRRTRGLARRALAQELRQKGVAAPLVEEALSEVSSASEEETALALVERRLRSLEGLAPHVAQRRLMGLLARKGYDGETAARVVRDALARWRFGEHDEDPGPD